MTGNARHTVRHTLTSRRIRNLHNGSKSANRIKSAEWTYEFRPCTNWAARAGWLRRLAHLGVNHLAIAAESAETWYAHNS